MEVFLTVLGSLLRPDERFIMHRYYSSRLALAVGVLCLVIWFNYDLIVRQDLRWDLLIVAGVMALTKIGAMVYYHRTH
jgi:hypothetical protein